jgi:hypothetical protein
MPNDTTPLLPPDPDKPGWWWLQTKDARIFGAQWSPAAGCWTFGSERKGRSPSSLARYGYTLATRHRIPTPAELEAVHQVVETLLDVANLAVITPQDEQHVGPVVYAASGAQVQALRDAAAMLRAALGGGA